MPVMTCRIGDTLRIDDAIRVTVLARCCSRVSVSVLAAPGTELVFDGVTLQPLVLATGTRSYQFSLAATRHFRVGELQVRITLPGETVPEAVDCLEYVHVGLFGPGPMRIGCESADMPTAARSAAPRLVMSNCPH